ncbi:MAG: sigma-54-dependent Fis family transcriptional regulator [Deltaproteobacteria bacterium]|nr:sigma-54-dependent Fis family transcriptional regulator [Deltaproteobacteria bacterium]
MSPAGRVFVVDDDDLIASMLARAMKKEGYEVKGADSAAGLAAKISAWSPDVVMLDVSLGDASGLDVLREIQERGIDTEVVMLTADSTATTAVKALKAGAAEYLTKPFDLEEVKVVVRRLIDHRKMKRELTYLKRVGTRRRERGLVYESAPMKVLREQVEKLADAGVSTVLITGESGTGKELVARHLHARMRGDLGSAETPFLAINCAALPPNLIESELFGHERGAFTDAKADKKGVFELAEGGSLLLDEIGEMPLLLQPKLLRVLEERLVRRIGGKDDIPIHVTVLAATNRNLGEAVQKGQFRSDLFYRLNAFAVHLPPLRERGRDVVLLARHFLARFAERYKKKPLDGFSPDAEEALLAYSWPGNVRELRNLVERLVVLEAGDRGTVELAHLPREILEPRQAVAEAPAPMAVLQDQGISLEDVKRNLIVSALEKAGHNRAEAARLLQVSYDTLRYQMKKFGLD